MKFKDFNEVVKCLAKLPNLKSLYTNLFNEEEVDILMRNMGDLEFLNGLPVEREQLHSDDSFGTDSETS